MTGREHPPLEATAAYAGSFHAGQVDCTGRPHVEKLIDLAAMLERLFPDASMAERHAVWLHDVLTRTSMRADELAALGYAPEVIEILEAVATATASAGASTERIEALATDGRPAALRVMIVVLTAAAAEVPAERDREVGSDTAEILARLHRILAGRSPILDATDPTPSDMIPVVLSVEPVEHSVLTEAAALAERSLTDFILEEASGLAHRIVVTGSVRHVDLARDRRARNMRLIQAIRNMTSS